MMESTGRAVIILALVFIVRNGFCHSIIDPNPNPFDGGPINSCRIPSFSSGSICRNYVNYEVPSSIARLADIIEEYITLNLNDVVRSECIEAYKNVLCAQRFPRCEGNGTLLLGEQRRNTSGWSQCSSIILDRTRNQEVRLPLEDTCRSVDEQTREIFTFQRCQVNKDNMVTPWMLEYLKMVDQTVQQENSALYDPPHSGCGNQLASHLCNFIGRCASDGVNVEYINTYESCSDAINCYNYDLQVAVSESIDCELWPVETDRIVMVPTKMTSNKPKDNTQLPSFVETSDNKGQIVFVVSSSENCIASLFCLLLSVILFLVLS